MRGFAGAPSSWSDWGRARGGRCRLRGSGGNPQSWFRRSCGRPIGGLLLREGHHHLAVLRTLLLPLTQLGGEVVVSQLSALLRVLQGDPFSMPLLAFLKECMGQLGKLFRLLSVEDTYGQCLEASLQNPLVLDQGRESVFGDRLISHVQCWLIAAQPVGAAEGQVLQVFLAIVGVDDCVGVRRSEVDEAVVGVGIDERSGIGFACELDMVKSSFLTCLGYRGLMPIR